MRDEIRREHERLLLVHKQIKTLEAGNSAAYRAPAKGPVEAKAAQLAQLKAIGPQIAQVLTNEVFYRDFKNRRQKVGSCFGLTDTPYDVGPAGDSRASAKPATTAHERSQSSSLGCG